MKNLILLITISAIGLWGCSSGDDTPTPTPDNYIYKNGTYYELTKGQLTASLYDGGPNYHIAIFMSNDDVSFALSSDEVEEAFNGVGNGFFVNLLTTDSFVTGNYTAMEGWIGFDNFNFNNPPDEIYDIDNLPSNFMYLDDRNVSFTILSGSTYKIVIDDADLKVNYTGSLTWYDE